MSAEEFDSIAFTRRHAVRLTDGREYPIEAVDFERREVKYYSESDYPPLGEAEAHRGGAVKGIRYEKEARRL